MRTCKNCKHKRACMKYQLMLMTIGYWGYSLSHSYFLANQEKCISTKREFKGYNKERYFARGDWRRDC